MRSEEKLYDRKRICSEDRQAIHDCPEVAQGGTDPRRSSSYSQGSDDLLDDPRERPQEVQTTEAGQTLEERVDQALRDLGLLPCPPAYLPYLREKITEEILEWDLSLEESREILEASEAEWRGLLAEALEGCDGKGGVYIIKSGGSTAPRVKIGYTSNIESRIKYLQTGNPYPLTLIGYIPGGNHHLEALLKRRFRYFRVRGEWFIYAKEIKSLLSDLEGEGKFKRGS